MQRPWGNKPDELLMPNLCPKFIKNNQESATISKNSKDLPIEQFSEKVKRALAEGTTGNGRGFVLMLSSSPCGRKLSSLAMQNYEKILEIATNL